MKKTTAIYFLLLVQIFYGQKLEFKTLLEDKISIRALQLWDNKVWYAGTDSKFGYVSLKKNNEKKQFIVSDKKLEFRALAKTKTGFYFVNTESPCYWYYYNILMNEIQLLETFDKKSMFVDSFMMDQKDRGGIMLSDPDDKQNSLSILFSKTKPNKLANAMIYEKGEAHFAASNTNIAMKKDWVWIATGGTKARIFKFNWNNPPNWQVFETPFIQGTSSQGIYSIDFYDEKFGIAVGGDYTKQAENINNIATTFDGGDTWQIQASGKNGGYKTCVKIRPKSKGKDIIAVGDQNIEFSNDFGKTWTTISEEKNLYVCEWIDENTLVFAGKDRILKAEFKN